MQIRQDMNILVVDDFSTMRSIVKDLLRELGFSRFEEAEDGVRAWMMIQSGHYDFIVSDWNMPNMTGLELLKRVRNDSAVKHIPFLLISAEAKKSQIIEATEEGVNDYIVKPFTAATLNEKIHSIFNNLPENES